MGFGESGSLTKTKAISLHRAARRALEAAGKHDGLLEDRQWQDYLARVATVGSATAYKNLNWRLERLGLIQRTPDGIVVMFSDYSDIIAD